MKFKLTLKDGRSVVLTDCQLEERPIEYIEFLEHSVSFVSVE